MIKRRQTISLIIGFCLAVTSTIFLSFVSKKSSLPKHKRNLPFLLGWYDDINNIHIPNQIFSEGIAFLMPYVDQADKKKIQSFLDSAEKVGVKVLLELSRPLVELENILGVKDFVNTYKKHPSVYGWYLYDEPEVKKPKPLAPNSLKKLYQFIKQEDPSKPVALVISNIDEMKDYTEATDILMWDSYPCEEKVSEFEWASSYRSALLEVVALAQIQNKEFWNVIQAYGEGHFNKRLPTKAEFRYMFYLSILAGADGLLFWIHYYSSASWNELVLYPTVKEFRDYIPAIVQGEDFTHQVQVNNSNIEAKLFSIPNTKTYLMIVANHNHSSIPSNLKLSQEFASKVVKVKQESNINLSPQASFDVVLDPYEIRLYQIG